MSARGRFFLPTDFEDVRVRLRNAEGKYLASDPTGWTFSEHTERAFLFDYVGDRIEEYLESVARMQGIVLKAVPVGPRELLETCDQCYRLVAASVAFFDGHRFLCPRCRTKLRQPRYVD